MSKLTLLLSLTLSIFLSLFSSQSLSYACDDITYDYVPYTVQTVSNGIYTASDTQHNTITFTNGDIRKGDNIKPGDIVNAIYDPNVMSDLNSYLAIEKEYGTYSPDYKTLTYKATIESFNYGYYQAITDDMTQTIWISPDMIKGKNITLGSKVNCVFDAKEYKLLSVDIRL